MRPETEQTSTAKALITIRPAREEDVPAIVALVNDYARRGDLLPRSLNSVYTTLDDWLVAAVDDEILGCVSLLRYGSGLYEVRSLAVHARAQGRGVGTRLMRALLAEARTRQIPTLFALTRVVAFFHRFGYVPTRKERFPEKVWRDCWQCPLLENCDETAMVLHLEPELGSGSAPLE